MNDPANAPAIIRSPDAAGLGELCQRLRALASTPGAERRWPAKSLELCARYGVFEWFVDAEWGGQGWHDQAVIEAYLELSAACLTTTFVITQRTGACRRIAKSNNDWAQSQLLPPLVRGDRFATVGISHLTTSRRHLRQPVLRARPRAGGYVLDGYSPWVTGAAHAEHVVVGATLADDRQLLIALPTDLPGVEVGERYPLVGLVGSDTAELHLREVEVDRAWLLAGPSANVMRQGVGARTGGLQTSTLALGLTAAILGYLREEGARRAAVLAAADALAAEHAALRDALLAAACGDATMPVEEIRLAANCLVNRAARAALVVAKGAGYVDGHPVARWLREAHFFDVWSLPGAVAEASLGRLSAAPIGGSSGP
ncbi:MAG: acyl-CoA/acyl-ACP dehydrogenase, partial [Myxococcales bacterium]|nr:acyl-CoA/acyl-ACP dehydrogenase [Myxococcales bacterium]